jgi:hypothetical protein
MSAALAGFGSLLSVALGIVRDGHGPANAVWTDASQSPQAVMYSKQTGGSTTGKQPPIA